MNTKLRVVAFVALASAAVSCASERITEPVRRATLVGGPARVFDAASPGVVETIIPIGIGGAYTVQPRGGVLSSFDNYVSPDSADLLIWEVVPPRPTGIRLPAGLPVRVIATGIDTATPTTAFTSEFCPDNPGAFACSKPRPFRFYPWGFEDTGGGPMQVQWGPNRLPQIRQEPADSTITAWTGPIDADTGLIELHVGRRGRCCYGFMDNFDGTLTPFETHSGKWVVTVQPEDGSTPETFANPLVWMEGPLTHTVPADSVTMNAVTAPGLTIAATKWWYVPDVANQWDGTPIVTTAAAMRRPNDPGAGDGAGSLRNTLRSSTAWTLDARGQLVERSASIPARPFASQPVTKAIARQVTPARGSPAFVEVLPSATSELTSCAGATTCRIAPGEAGSIVAKLTLADGRILSASNGRSTSAPPAAFIAIAAASGPNGSNRSFTTRDSVESRISLTATVTPNALASRVQWIVSDEPSDLSPSVPPAAVDSGTPSGFLVAKAQQASRYRSYSHATAVASLAGLLNRISLAFRVHANVTDDQGQTAMSLLDAVVRQDTIDTIREEYVELGIAGGPPKRSSFGPPSPFVPDSGDYPISLSDSTFASMIHRLVDAWSDATHILLMGTVNSGYRNPVHTRYHVPDASRSSPHMLGCAIDFQTYPVVTPGNPRTAADTAAAKDYWQRLAAAAVDVGLTVEARDPPPDNPLAKHSGIGHVHVDTPCQP